MMEETRETAFEPCPYCGATAWYKDDAVDFLHHDECQQGDCEPYRISLVGVEHIEKWNDWAKRIEGLGNGKAADHD